ncbi:biotin-dependent carboxyltransferase family protein [Acerihabitans sp. TG2]|uniref:5-oxoprolinase subunit C family protein n=1 Tax=Acerihabitans sp. TG2 TaxID=3096008 RepID=UPI002B223AE8|nr:biotin-dependent carboxyltransferase family protein [Acerihabitans sp. TG2]MEA9389272.1 biotin-dependent carboxyltransferase family protein [Acerihabitans sp. TG2]
MIVIEKTTPLSSVQDLGRTGSLHYGVGTAGVMDPLALQLGNAMLGNVPNAAAIEIPLFPFQVRFMDDCCFAVTGHDGRVMLDDVMLPFWWSAQARKGQRLTLHASRRTTRAYLHLPGGVDVPAVLGSRSTQLRGEFGGFQGRGLHQGDRLYAIEPKQAGPVDFGIMPPWYGLGVADTPVPLIRVLPAAEYGIFTEDSCQAFWLQAWQITPQSNRYGYRLSGQPLIAKAPLEMRSHGIVPGVIQIPHNGQPIIQMRDAQPSGGYPKFGTVIDADMWVLGQIPVGSLVRFIQVSYQQARVADAQQQAYLQKVIAQIDCHRRYAG